MHLHSHASLEFRRQDFSLLCDPWLEGLAFFGAWRHYPKPRIKARDLNPSAIWISHEHSDHFHPQTLSQFDRSIPIYIPSFLNHRLEERLQALGFKKIISLGFGERVQLANAFYLTIYEPASLWNDSQALLEIDGFRILNINDAGVNYRIHQEIGRVDCIASSFSPGASGYPATFTHLSREEKKKIYLRSKDASLEMLLEVCRLYEASYFLPFASHFVLNHPKHLPYMQLVEKNTLEDVKEKFGGSGVSVIDLLAGDSFDLKTCEFKKLARDAKLYTASHIQREIHREFDLEEFESYYPDARKYALDMDLVFAYFKNLNLVPEMRLCEDLSVSVYPDFSSTFAFSFEIKEGSLKILDSLLQAPNLTIKIPSEILMYICKHNESWDEATIGYWCEFSRNPDVYHAEFWRMLQAPFYLKSLEMHEGSRRDQGICEQSNIAGIMEELGEVGAKIMSRYGLYCLTCHKAPMETLKQACNMHGINQTKMQRLIKELNLHLGQQKV